MYMTYKQDDNGDYIINLYDKKNDYLFGYLDLFDNEDCYIITGRVIHFEVDADVKLFGTRKQKLYEMFVKLQSMIKEGEIDTQGKQVLILSDELISRDAIRRMDLKRVPRYCGYYFI